MIIKQYLQWYRSLESESSGNKVADYSRIAFPTSFRRCALAFSTKKTFILLNKEFQTDVATSSFLSHIHSNALFGNVLLLRCVLSHSLPIYDRPSLSRRFSGNTFRKGIFMKKKIPNFSLMKGSFWSAFFGKRENETWVLPACRNRHVCPACRRKVEF